MTNRFHGILVVTERREIAHCRGTARRAPTAMRCVISCITMRCCGSFSGCFCSRICRLPTAVLNEVVRRRYADTEEMLRLLYGSLIRYLQDQGVIATTDFDATPCPDVTLKDISRKKLRVKFVIF